MTRWLGLGFLAIMPIHVALRPEHGWLLLSACDVAAIVIAIGAVFAWPRVVAIAGLFALAVGTPAFVLALATTTYPLNPTGVIVHVVPPLLGALAIAKHGPPPRAPLIAWCGYAATFLASYLLAPAALNINLATRPWPPLARVFTVAGTFQGALLAFVGMLLWTGDAVIRSAVRARAARRATS